jgi:lysophospholipase L1-like esterase
MKRNLFTNVAGAPRWRRWSHAVLALGCAGMLVLVSVLPAAAAEPIPNSMDGLGDSITRGFDACGFYVDCVSRSWSTGTTTSVNSHYLRILAKNPAISGHNYNDAKTGAKMVDVVTQAQTAASRTVDYVTVLAGANDACTSTVADMTPTATFQSEFKQVLDTLTASNTNTLRVFVSSVPDAYRLWQIGHTSASAVRTWNGFKICQSMLANPTSTSTTDEARRQQVRQQIIAYNQVLSSLCAGYAHCKFDGNAVFNYPFVLSQISTWDYFHPNTTGQTVLASVTYAAGFGW